jgi:hypothetical protein
MGKSAQVSICADPTPIRQNWDFGMYDLERAARNPGSAAVHTISHAQESRPQLFLI